MCLSIKEVELNSDSGLFTVAMATKCGRHSNDVKRGDARIGPQTDDAFDQADRLKHKTATRLVDFDSFSKSSVELGSHGVDFANSTGVGTSGAIVEEVSDLKNDFLVDKSSKFDSACSSTADTVVFIAPPSPKGICIEVYRKCMEGTCQCIHYIGGRRSQLKPCRFASYIFNTKYPVSEEFLFVFNGVVDGFDVIDVEPPSYECPNYGSILEVDAHRKMQRIIDRESTENFVSRVGSAPHCVHSMGAVPKADGGIRPITDCSMPRDNSINFHCDSLFNKFSFRGISTAVDLLDQGDYLSVADLKSAYRLVPINPQHRKYLGFKWGDSYFVDNRLCFGLRTGPYIFNCISNFIYHIISKFFDIKVVNYLDDFLLISNSMESSLLAQKNAIKIFRFLGFYVAWDKVTPPSTYTKFLGICIDTDLMELSIPDNKVTEVTYLVDKFLEFKNVTKKEIETLTGHLSHCAQVVRGGRLFCRNLYNLYKRIIHSGAKKVFLDEASRNDLLWWKKFFITFNHKSTIKKLPYPISIYTDSSLKGYAAYMGADWLAGPWDPKNFNKLDTDCNHILYPPVNREIDYTNINVLELFPILAAIQVWGPRLRGHLVNIFTDNTQVLHMLRNLSSTNVTCLGFLHELFWLCAEYDIDIDTSYINTKENIIADTLSRIAYRRTSRVVDRLLSNSNLCCLDVLISQLQ